MNDTLSYGRIIFGGLAVTVAYNLCSGILRALGDSKTPFKAIIISSTVNIVLDILMIFLLKSGVAGAAIATITAQLVSVIICIFKMIDCQVKCNKINEKIYKALRGEYENQGVYGDDY